MIICVAGDPGGSRAVLPVAIALHNAGETLCIPGHGFLGRELPEELLEYLCDKELAESKIAHSKALVFGSSTDDVFPLSLARKAKALEIPVIHILDSWSTYKQRLCTDKLPMLVPDLYTAIDEFALDGAIAEGVPQSCLQVTGHPGMAMAYESITQLGISEKRKAAQKLGVPTNRLHIAFVNEPFRTIFGTEVTNENHPGFIEEDVLARFVEALRQFLKDVYVSVLPHPKQNPDEVSQLWEKVRGGVSGRVLHLDMGRDVLGTVSGVAGMASILLYEAWLLGLPVLSMQPNCRFPSMRRFEFLDEIHYTKHMENITQTTVSWLEQCQQQGVSTPRSDMFLHKNAPMTIASLVQQHISRII